MYEEVLPLLSFMFSFITAIMMLRAVIVKRYKEFGGIAISYALFSIHPLAMYYILNVLPTAHSHAAEAKLIMTAVFFLVAIGFSMMWFSIIKLSGKEFQVYELSVVLMLVIGTSIYTSSIKPRFSERWALETDPKWAPFMMGIPMVIIIADMIRISFPTSNSLKKRTSKILMVGWITVASSIIFAAVERLFSADSTYYLVPASLGFSLIGLALYRDPFALVPKVIGGQFLLISDRKTGNPLFKKRLNTDAKLSEKLFSPAMRGVLDVMSELTGETQIPEILGYRDLKIVVVHSNRYLVYFVCHRVISPLRKELERMVEELENGELNQSKMRKEIERTITHRLTFAF